ncbi:UDP-N-acetylmuramoyl-L-alanyl-D-glutamate--2,6-diaminopimelate ligase [Bacillus tianshenii]|nr:UDP-N-acetylmuramoyl-L-alanyl-D-glutamate--2,6-diaminopimelate ligase [Bacillus tianshenii]
MELHTLLKALKFYHIHNEANPVLTGIEMDSRLVQPGSLFVCVRGYTVDGHRFAESAVENGAAAIVAEEKLDVSVPVIVVSDSKRALAMLSDLFYGCPTQKMRLIGVTGTNGKTTTTHMIDEIFRVNGEKTGMIGTIHIKMGDETIPVTNTTPESVVLQQNFSKMEKHGVQTAVMEVSSHALDLGRVRGCDFDVAVFTNLTQDHLDYHETMDEYRRAKGLLFAQLGGAFHPEKPKYAVLNMDDTASEQYARSTAAHVLTYGINKQADVRAESIQMTNQGTTFTLVTPVGSTAITMKFVGRFSIYNVLAAAAAAIACDVKLTTVAEAIEGMEGVAGRFELVNAGQPFSVIVDYAHTPDSLENVLKTVKDVTEQKIYCIVGCGGDRDKTKRPLMAKIAAHYADEAVLTSDNPRSEDPEQILRDMEAGIADENYTTITDRKEAIHYAVSKAQAGDVVLIAGKGHETYQIIGDKTYDFDDRVVAAQAVKERYE